MFTDSNGQNKSPETHLARFAVLIDCEEADALELETVIHLGILHRLLN